MSTEGGGGGFGGGGAGGGGEGGGGDGGGGGLGGAAQVEIESKIESTSSYFSFKRLVPGGFNLGLIGSTCTAPPRRRRGGRRRWTRRRR